MACVISLTAADDSRKYWLVGTGWVTDPSTATTYSNKEAALGVATTQRATDLANGGRVSIKDQSTGEEHAVQLLS